MSSYYEKFLASGEVKCIDDEIPFEIPESWCWVRLGTIIDFSKSSSVKPNEIAFDAWVLDLEDIEKDSGLLLTKKRMRDIQSKSDKHIFYSGNVLYSKLRPYLNKVIIADENGYCTSEILAFDFGMILNKYAQIYLMSPYFVDYAMSDAYGIKMPRLGSKQGNNALMPLPPFNEQVRIAEQLSAVAPVVGKYTSSQNELDKLNAEIFDKLKKSVLQEAIQGKLVPQDSNDEPASVLLERIKEEKSKLFKEGKLKKTALTDSVIYKGDDNKYYEQVGKDVYDITEEIAFDLPNGWNWCRLKDIGSIFTGATFKKEEAITTRRGVRILRGGNILPFELKFKDDDIFLTEDKVKKDIILKENDILTPAVTSLENIGKMARVDDDMLDTTVGGFVFIIRLNLINRWFSKYILYTLSSPSIIDFMKSITNKSGQAFYNIGKERLLTALLPIPPLKEQQRIVAQIERLFEQLK